MATDSDWFSDEIATFGDRIAGAREAAGMSQSQLARRLGVRLKTLADWEQDLSEPRANKLQMLAGLLNVSLMWLLTGRGDGVDSPPDDLSAEPPDHKALLAEMRQMRTEALALAERLGRAERRLRAASKASA